MKFVNYVNETEDDKKECTVIRLETGDREMLKILGHGNMTRGFRIILDNVRPLIIKELKELKESKELASKKKNVS